MEKSFSAGSIIKESYRIIKPQFWTVVGRFALLMVLFMFLSIGANNDFIVRLLVSSLSSYVIVLFSMAYAGGGQFRLDTLFENISFKRFVYFFLTCLLAGLAIFGGIILLVIPGIILAVRFAFVRYISVEKGLAPREALKASVLLTKGYRWKIFGFALLCVLINILGALCLLVGLFFTLPLTAIAFGIFYRKLSAPRDEVAEVIVAVVE